MGLDRLERFEVERDDIITSKEDPEAIAKRRREDIELIAARIAARIENTQEQEAPENEPEE